MLMASRTMKDVSPEPTPFAAEQTAMRRMAPRCSGTWMVVSAVPFSESSMGSRTTMAGFLEAIGVMMRAMPPPPIFPSSEMRMSGKMSL